MSFIEDNSFDFSKIIIPISEFEVAKIIVKPFSILGQDKVLERAIVMGMEDHNVFRAIDRIGNKTSKTNKKEKKERKMRTVMLNNPPVETIKALIKSAGTNIGSVHFYKKDDSIRKMCYRLHVKNPSIAKFKTDKNSKISKQKQKTDKANDLLTVYDVNKVVRDEEDNKIGRGAWRSINLNTVIRIVAAGVEYLIVRK